MQDNTDQPINTPDDAVAKRGLATDLGTKLLEGGALTTGGIIVNEAWKAVKDVLPPKNNNQAPTDLD
jgi:hypothetical protein